MGGDQQERNLNVSNMIDYYKISALEPSLTQHEKNCQCPQEKVFTLKLNGHRVIKLGTKELVEPIYL